MVSLLKGQPKIPQLFEHIFSGILIDIFSSASSVRRPPTSYFLTVSPDSEMMAFFPELNLHMSLPGFLVELPAVLKKPARASAEPANTRPADKYGDVKAQKQAGQDCEDE